MPPHLAPPGSPQAKQLHHLHAQLSLGKSCHRKKSLVSMSKGSLKSCLILGNPVNCGLPGFSFREEDSQGLNTGVYWPIMVAIPFFSSVAQSCPTLCNTVEGSMPGLPVHHQLPEPSKPMSIESVMPSNHLIFCCTLLLLCSIFTSIRVFSNESALHIRCPQYWSFSFNISPPNEHPGLISFRMDWLYLLAVQGTLKSLLQDHSSKA